MNLADSIAQARKSGYSDAEITAYLSKDATLSRQVTQARKVGYTDNEIVSHLAHPSFVEQAKDVARQGLAGLSKGVAGFADTVLQAGPLGMVNNALQTANDVGNLFSGKAGQIRPAPAPISVFSQAVASHTPQARSTAGEYSHTIGQNIPNAVAPGSAGARVVNVLAPALMSETAGQVARRAGAGPRGEAAARIAGSVAGAATASVRPQNVFAPAGSPAGQLAARARQDPAAMQQRANEFRSAGVDPTLTDVVDDAGRGVIRAAANRGTPARQQANQFATGRALNLPDRIGTQARRVISADPRTPDQIAQNLGDARGQAANTAFGAVRGDALPIDSDMATALNHPMGREAIAEAARRERDPAVRQALLQLPDQLGQQGAQLTVGMADRVSRTLLGKAQAAARTGDNDLAATYSHLADAVRSPARSASPGYDAALGDYARQSQLMDAAGRGEDFLKRNTDEFVANTPANGQAGNALARATARRAIERQAGENPAAAPGVARRLAEAPEQQARNAHLLGPQDAERLQQGMRLEARAVDNANMVAPRTGSSTHLNDVDAAKIAGLAQVGQRALRHDWVGLGMDWLRSRGLSDRDAEALIQMATDPRQTDRAIGLIAQRAGNAQPFIAWRNAGLIGAAALTSAGAPASAQQPQQR